MRFAVDVLGLVGHTPLVRLNRAVPKDAATVLAKVESMNPGGSVKDRIAIKLLERGEKEGRLQRGGWVVEPTSGNTGIGLALACAARGYRLVCVMPDKVPVEKVRLLELLGAEILLCPTAVPPEDSRSYYSVSRRIERERKAYRPDQYNNQGNPEAHYLTTGPEIWEDTNGRLDAFVCGVGTGGTITGTGRYLKEKKPKVLIVGVDPAGSILKEAFEQGTSKSRPKTYLIDGIGEDFVPATLSFDVVDEFIRVTDADAYAMAMRMAREEGLLVGSSGGAAVHAAVQVAQRMGEGKLIVTLLPDSGERYLSKLNPEWLGQKGLAIPPVTAR